MGRPVLEHERRVPEGREARHDLVEIGYAHGPDGARRVPGDVRGGAREVVAIGFEGWPGTILVYSGWSGRPVPAIPSIAEKFDVCR